MTDYQKYINALRKCAKEHENDVTFFAHIIVSDLCRDTANLLETLEQEPCEGRMKYVQETVNTIMDSCKTDSIKDKCFRNVARFIQNAIDGSIPEFELINDAEPCDDCISREGTLRAIIKHLGIKGEEYLLEAEKPIYKVIKNMPSIQPTAKENLVVEDCISRTEAIKALEYDLSLEADGGFDKYRTVIKDLLNAIYNTQKAQIEALPSVTPKPKTGHWINHQECRWIYAKCSECGTVHDTRTNYCPDCGCRMFEPQESEETE